MQSSAPSWVRRRPRGSPQLGRGGSRSGFALARVQRLLQGPQGSGGDDDGACGQRVWRRPL